MSKDNNFCSHYSCLQQMDKHDFVQPYSSVMMPFLRNTAKACLWLHPLHDLRLLLYTHPLHGREEHDSAQCGGRRDDLFVRALGQQTDDKVDVAARGDRGADRREQCLQEH